MKQELLRGLPKVDVLTGMAETYLKTTPEETGEVTEVARVVVAGLREQILKEERASLPGEQELLEMMRERYEERRQRSLRRVINATGITLHTNLGRSILSEEAAEAAKQAACSYSTLEYELETASRGIRYSHVDKLLLKLCGGEAAMVVNNNAAAVMLILSTMARNKSVVISRGELVEIGGSFRVPEIMEMSGGYLKEVGTTNKTHPEDFSRAVDEDTAAFLKVHTSNFKMIGFTEEVSLEELVSIGHEHNVPVIYDMGSGSLISLNQIKGVCEPDVQAALKLGVDVVCFSGDKLLGGPQAGIIVGKREYIEAMKANPLTRAFRVDKMTLAALEVTLRQYIRGNAKNTVPTLQMLLMSQKERDEKYEKLDALLRQIPGLRLKRVETETFAGGGSMPGILLPATCVGIAFAGVSAAALEQEMRKLKYPIIARIHNDMVLLDVRTIQEHEFTLVQEELRLLKNKFEA